MERILTRSVLECIDFYQKHISPRKGYKCAYGALYGKSTCSAYGKKVIKRFGFFIGMKLLMRQFERCQSAGGRKKKYPRGFCTPGMICSAPLAGNHAVSGGMCEPAPDRSTSSDGDYQH